MCPYPYFCRRRNIDFVMYPWGENYKLPLFGVETPAVLQFNAFSALLYMGNHQTGECPPSGRMGAIQPGYPTVLIFEPQSLLQYCVESW